MIAPAAIRMIIIEDDGMLRENLRLLLSGEPGFEVLAAFETAEAALERLAELNPDIVLSDINLPGISGIEFVREAKARFPDLEIMAHTINEDRGTVFAALKAGANGYVIKGTRPSALIEALYTLHEGGAPMSPKIARSVVRELQDASLPSTVLLSTKEVGVLGAVQEGLSYKEIGARLHISPHTVHSHIKKIYGKLQAKDKLEALEKARRRGLL